MVMCTPLCCWALVCGNTITSTKPDLVVSPSLPLAAGSRSSSPAIVSIDSTPEPGPDAAY